MEKLKKVVGGQSFVTGAVTLVVASILCKIIGVGFRIPLANIVGNYGMGVYHMVFPLYALLLIISNAGIPVAISKMVAREKAKGDIRECRKILYSSLVMLGVIGGVISVVFFLLAGKIASLQGNPETARIFMAIAPAVLFVCLISGYRGYFQGFGNMIPTALSQIVEQIIKVGLGLTMVVLLIDKGIYIAISGAIMALVLSEIVSLGVLITIFYIHSRKQKIQKQKTEDKKENGRMVSFRTMKSVFMKALPITLMASIFPLLLVFDSMVVVSMLEASGNSVTNATRLYGISSGTVHTLVNMPAVLGIAVATAVVPMIASLLKKGNKEEVHKKSQLAVLLVAVVSIFFFAFYMFFGRELITLLYERAFKENPGQMNTAVNLLKIESVMILLMGFVAVFSSILQGSGKSGFPLVAMASGAVVKVVFQLIFIRTSMGIYAVSVANVLCFVVVFVLNTIFICRVLKIKPIEWKSLLRILLLGFIYSCVLLGLFFLLPSGKLWILLAGFVAFATYVFLIWVLKIVDFRKIFGRVKTAKSVADKTD